MKNDDYPDKFGLVAAVHHKSDSIVLKVIMNSEYVDVEFSWRQRPCVVSFYVEYVYLMEGIGS